MNPDQKSILFKISKFPQLSETFVVNQIVTAIELGYDVKIIVGELSIIAENADIRVFKRYNLKEKIIVEKYNIPQVRHIRFLKSTFLILKNLRYLKSLLRYFKEVKKDYLKSIYEFDFFKRFKNYEIIHIQFGTNKNPIDILKKIKFYRNKLVVSFHGHDVHFPINNIIPNNGYYNRLFEVADHLVVNTLFLKEKLRVLGAPENKIRVIPVAVNTKLFKPDFSNNMKAGKFRIVTVGRLNELKGQKFGIMAVKNLLSKGFDVEYIIAGAGPSKKDLEKQIQEEKLTGHVVLSGKVYQEEIVHLLQSSDLFLMTSVTNSFEMQESQGLVTGEAQACGLPVIGFDSGGVKYTISQGETGFIVPERDVEAMVEKIEMLITNPDLRSRLGENAQEFIDENFSEKHISEVWRETYKNLIIS